MQQFSSGQNLDLERLVAAQPDLVLAFATGQADTASYHRLQQAGVPGVVVAEYRGTFATGAGGMAQVHRPVCESRSPGRGNFCGPLQKPIKPSWLWQKPGNLSAPTVFYRLQLQKGTWYVPGGESHAPQMLRDAGANYLWADTPPGGQHSAGL